jgi:cellulose synthase/poly-beta-1,6-N-acetylglucosamine synthase-like glycosyltransferase
MTEIIIWVFAISIVSIYSIFIGSFNISWCLLKKEDGEILKTLPIISIIIAAKNEERNIGKCLESIVKQDYPTESFEVIIINDHSTDNSVEIINDFIQKTSINNIKLINSDDNSFGKKSALGQGIKNAVGELIITTDADCTMGVSWLSTIAAFYVKKSADIILGPVCVNPGNGFFSKIQSLEFMSLIGITGGSAGMNSSVMANGANLSFKKSLFNETGGYKFGEKYASGDDMFFIQQVKKNKTKTIRFIKDINATVYTNSQTSISGFFHQRARWAGKLVGYNDLLTIILAISVFLINISLVVGTALLFIEKEHILLPLLLVAAMKFIVDFPVLWSTTHFFKLKKLLWLFPITFLIYPFYVTIAVVLGITTKPKWK